MNRFAAKLRAIVLAFGMTGTSMADLVATDLTNWDANLDDGIEADAGETTTRSLDIAGLASEDGKLFFRVETN